MGQEDMKPIIERKQCSDFSIERLLRTDKESSDKTKSRLTPGENESQNKGFASFAWLHCSRFRPPKLPRIRKPAPIRSNRGPRIPFSPKQIAVLENTFQISQYLSSDAINTLANQLFLTEIRVKIWFQNRRARHRRETTAAKVQSPHLFDEPSYPQPLLPPTALNLISRHGHILPFIEQKIRQSY